MGWSDTSLLAVALAAAAGVLAGRAWAAARHPGGGRGSSRTSPHYAQALHYLTAGRREQAISELQKVPHASAHDVDVGVVLGNLLREAGQVERAVQVHQELLSHDLSRGERSLALVCLGADFQKAGFLDRAMETFRDVLELDPGNIHALSGIQRLHEEQRQWRDALHVQTRLSRLRKSDDRLALGYLQAEIGREAAAGDRRAEAEEAFEAALALDRRVFPAWLGLADLHADADPRRAAALLEESMRAVPERSYLALPRLARLYASCGEPSRFVALCERLISASPREWRARLALARHLRAEGQADEAFGLLLRAMEANPQVLAVHLEIWRTLRALGLPASGVADYVAAAEDAVFYAAPHVCTSCRYRAEDVLWRCPQCHQWNTFVEERLGPPPSGG